VHLFDFAEDLYAKHLRVALVDFLRPEMKFDGIEALKAQIAADGVAARKLLEARGFTNAPAPFVALT
jgi:riboflavin kinase / FMN adenylyltransferase